MESLRIGVSSCLLGNRVRYDGEHKLDRYIAGTLGNYLELVPVCPEFEAGLGVPRERMRLAGDPEAPRLVITATGTDLTARMRAWIRHRLPELAKQDLAGFIFKSGSPSCAIGGLPVAPGGKAAAGTGGRSPVSRGAGLFARAFRERFPLVALEDEERLADPAPRESFIEALFVLRRWRRTLAGKKTRRALVEFHTRHKLILMSRSLTHYREMGKLVAEAASLPPVEIYGRYQTFLLAALGARTTVGKQVNVLQHIMGYFKNTAQLTDKAYLMETIEEYRKGRIPLVVPLTLLRQRAVIHRQPYLLSQWYLVPEPLELLLRTS